MTKKLSKKEILQIECKLLEARKHLNDIVASRKYVKKSMPNCYRSSSQALETEEQTIRAIVIKLEIKLHKAGALAPTSDRGGRFLILKNKKNKNGRK